MQSQGKYGQPTEWTHPHIIQKNQINKGIEKYEFKTRREKLIEKLLQLKNKGKHLLVLPAAKRKYMVDKIPYFYRKVKPGAGRNLLFNELIVDRTQTLDTSLAASNLTTSS